FYSSPPPRVLHSFPTRRSSDLVEQLHHVGAILALACERARDLLADRRTVVGKRHQPRFAALLLQAVPQHFGLRLLPALIEAFERNEISRHVGRPPFEGSPLVRRSPERGRRASNGS